MLTDAVTTVESLYRAAVDPETWPDALAATADYVGCSGAVFIRHDFSTGANLILQARLREDLIKPYFEHYAANPYSMAIAKERPSFGTVLASRLADPAEIRQTAFHADILAPQKMVEQIIYCHADLCRGGNTGGISITLDESHIEDLADIHRRFSALTRHFSRIIDLYVELGAHRERQQQEAAFLAALPRAAMLLDQHGGILSANPAGEALLAMGDGITVLPQPPLRPVAALPHENARLREFIRRALADAAKLTTELAPVMRLARRSARTPYVLIVTPLVPGMFGLWTGYPTARVLLQIVDPDEQRPVPGALLQRAFDLTATEARVASLIAGGSSVPQVGSSLGIAATTVRTHLTRCFDKTGVRSQIALANLVAALSSAWRNGGRF